MKPILFSVTSGDISLGMAVGDEARDASLLRVWTSPAWEAHILAGSYSRQACLADTAPQIVTGTMTKSLDRTSADSFLVARSDFLPQSIVDENTVLADMAATDEGSVIEEVCVLIATGTDRRRPFFAPGGILPIAETKGVHPAEVAWQLATSRTQREDFSSFHRFANTWHKTAEQWYRTWFYTTAPDDTLPLDPTSWASVGEIFAASADRHTRVIRQSSHLKIAMA